MTDVNHWSNGDEHREFNWSEYFYWQAAKYVKEHPEEISLDGPSGEMFLNALREAGLIDG